MAPPILLVVDNQTGIVDGSPEDGPRSTPDLTTNVAKLLSHWRHQSWPVIHVLHHDPDPTHPLNKDVNPDGHRAHPCCTPLDTEPVLVKTAGSAFTDPALRLAERLTQHGGKDGAEVVIVGMDGAQCINDNARGACDRGFGPVVVADACATYGMPHYRDKDVVIGAEETHAAAMSMLANGFAKVVLTEDLLTNLYPGKGVKGVNGDLK